MRVFKEYNCKDSRCHFSVTPTLSSPSLPSDSVPNNDNSAQSNPIEVDTSNPTTNIQIRLADGSRLVGTFNYTHTIGDIRRYINSYPFHDQSF